MSRSHRESRQCARIGCTCKPRHAARRIRERIADERRDPRDRTAQVDIGDLWRDGGPRHER